MNFTKKTVKTIFSVSLTCIASFMAYSDQAIAMPDVTETSIEDVYTVQENVFSSEQLMSASNENLPIPIIKSQNSLDELIESIDTSEFEVCGTCGQGLDCNCRLDNDCCERCKPLVTSSSTCHGGYSPDECCGLEDCL